VALLSGCGSPPPRAFRSDAVLLVTFDTFSVYRAGCYGASHVRTPEFDRLARTGVQVRFAVSPAPLTLPSHATLLTGLDPPMHGVRENGLFVLADEWVTVPELLPADVATGAFVGAFPVASRFGLAQGFDVYDDAFPPRQGARQRHQPMRRANAVFEPAAAWLTGPSAGARPFAWVHAFDPHYPYEPPLPWGRIAAQLGGTLYEGEVAYLDREFGRFLRRIGAHDAGRRATVILTADHGESLGDHVEITHGLFVYDATQLVPLVVAGPGIPARLDVAQRPLADVAPTVLFAYGVGPPADLRGVALQHPVSAGREAYVETKHTELLRGWSPLHGLRTERWKYVRAPRPELYDLARDPGETMNLVDTEPELAARLAARLDEILAGEIAPAIVTMEDEVAEQLRSLGYIATAEPGAAANTGIDPKDKAPGAAALFRGEEAYLEGNLANAERFLRRAIQLDPEAKEAHSFLAGTYHGLGRYALAVEHAETALRLPPHLNEAPIHATRGEALLELGRAKEALAAFREALKRKPGDPKFEELVRQAESALL
jgi:arylsulfatase A-like enzyme